MGIFDLQALMQDYSWIQKFFLGLFRTISLDTLKSIKNATGHEPYDIFKLLFPENILNHVLEHKSWSEYVNVILLPKKAMLSSIIMLISIFSMTMTVGYIKTALKFQNGQKASFHDMYQYFYLIPQYFLAKLMMLGLLILCATPFMGILFFIVPLFDNSNSFFLPIVINGLMVITVIAIYQRIKFMQYFVIDKDMRVIEACKTSWSVTKGSWIHLLVYSSFGIFLFSTNIFLKTLGTLYGVFYRNTNQQADVSIYKQLTQ